MAQIINLNEYRESKNIILNKEENQEKVYNDLLKRLKEEKEYTEFYQNETNWNMVMEFANSGLDW